MSYNLDLFKVIAHTDLTRLSPKMVALVDTVSELATESGYFRAFASIQRGCDLFDAPSMLRWAMDEKLLSPTDPDLFTAIELLEDRPAFFTAEEVEKRMAIADGHCPMCGNLPSFHAKGAYQPGMYQVLGHCGHFRYNSVHDVDAVLRDPKCWDGGRWPYSFGQRMADENGNLLSSWSSGSDKHEISTHCRGCRHGSAETLITRRLVTALTDFVKAAQDKSYHGLGASPTSALDGCETVVAMRVRQWAKKIVEQESCEFRLNQAGLKLYSRGLAVDYSHPGKVTFSVRVGGDQARDYASFVEFANDRLAQLGILEVKTTNGALVSSAD